MTPRTSLAISIIGLFAAAIITLPANGMLLIGHVIVLPLIGVFIVLVIGAVVGLVARKHKALSYMVTAAILIAFMLLTFPYRKVGRWWIHSDTFQPDHPMSKNI